MPTMPAYCHPTAYAAFARELPRIDSTRGLFRAAFAIAQHERPTANVDQAEAAVAQLVATVRGRLHSSNPQAKLAHLHDVLFDVVGFSGNVDDYYNPVNSYLPEVLLSRRGLPITLVLVYKCVAEGVGLTVHGVNAPGHFLAAVKSPATGKSNSIRNGWMYVDPFYGGGLLDHMDVCHRINDATGQEVTDATQFLTLATHRQWIMRMLNNLQALFAHAGRERDLYAMQELQSLLTT